MPRINRPKTSPTNEAPLLDRLAEILWKHGDVATPHCREMIVRAGIRLADVTPAMIHRAEEMNEERLREGFRATNAAEDHPVKVVMKGDGEFDPALNPAHPIRGAARLKQELEGAEAAAKSANAKESASATNAKTEDAKPRGQRYEAFGHPVTAVLRKIGQLGWTIEDGLLFVEKQGISCSPSTVKIQVRAGAKGERGEPATLTAEQLSELKKLLGKK